MSDLICPSCGSGRGRVFYQMSGAPHHSVLLLEKREQALNYPQGHIALTFCEACGFVWNSAFDPAVHEYSAKYEATQAYSPTFNAFHRRLAENLIGRFDLHHKTVIEIGCGQGEFLQLLSELGPNRGLGFDPAYRVNGQAPPNVEFIADFYSEKYINYAGDFVCCKMTLEHILPTHEFVRTVRGSVGERPETVVFFQVPNAQYVLKDLAFWDVYYEHCSYFTAGSLARLFRRCGFDVLNLWTDYDDQYLMIEARTGDGTGVRLLANEHDLEDTAALVKEFEQAVPIRIAEWRERLRRLCAQGRKAVIWGGGSKGVAFLTTLGLQDEIQYAVDVNPNKHGTFLAGHGQEVIAPERLKDYQPDVVIVMNPIYCPEIRQHLDTLGLDAELWPV